MLCTYLTNLGTCLLNHPMSWYVKFCVSVPQPAQISTHWYCDKQIVLISRPHPDLHWVEMKYLTQLEEGVGGETGWSEWGGRGGGGEGRGWRRVDCYKFATIQHAKVGGGDSSVVRAPDSWLKGRGFESLLERRENFLLHGQLSVLTLISVSVPPPCYHSST